MRHRIKYQTDEEFRIRHRERMRLRYHEKKAELLTLREQIRQAESDSDATVTDATMSDRGDTSDTTMSDTSDMTAPI